MTKWTGNSVQPAHLLFQSTFYISFKFCLTLGNQLWYSFAHLLAKVAQLVEPQIVDLVVAGSCPVFRPSLTSLLRQRGFFVFEEANLTYK